MVNMDPPPFPYAGYSEDIFKRVRVLFGGKFVADTNHPKFVWEHAYYPYYYIPKSDVKQEYFKNPKSTENETSYDMVVGGRAARSAATEFKQGDFAGYFKITFGDADAWLEENERIYVHPRDPYKRVTILPSSKHIRVEIDGVEVANTTSAMRLYETSLPTRSYIPISDVRLDLMTGSTLVTSCPYKGDASYFDVNLPSGKKTGLVWWYKSPTLESAPIKGLVAFYDEKVDIWVDGVKQERPVTKFS